jgi:hypothetical protein
MVCMYVHIGVLSEVDRTNPGIVHDIGIEATIAVGASNVNLPLRVKLSHAFGRYPIRFWDRYVTGRVGFAIGALKRDMCLKLLGH